MQHIICLLFYPAFLSDACMAQNASNANLFGRNPYAAAEAMGGTNTAIGNNLFSVFYNSAGI